MLIVDTHALLWVLFDDRRLHPNANEAVQDALHRQRLFVSAASYWELAHLLRDGKVGLGCDLRVWRARRLDSGIREIALRPEILILAEELRTQGAPRDLADRLIMATAVSERARLATADREILAWHGQIDRLDVRR